MMLTWWLLFKRLSTDSRRARHILFILSVTGANLTVAAFLYAGSNFFLMIPIAVLASLVIAGTLPSLVKGFEYDINVYRSLGAPSGAVAFSLILEVISIGVLGIVMGIFVAAFALVGYTVAAGLQTFGAAANAVVIGFAITLAAVVPGTMLISRAILRTSNASSGVVPYDR
jgi:ABC-type lipoprotein release transport system permease subunit